MNFIWRIVTLIGYFGLFGLLLLWFAWLETPVGIPVSLVLILLVGPLLFPLRGLLHGQLYTHSWSTFIALFYFMIGAFHAAGPMILPWLAWLGMSFSVMFFVGAIGYVRTGIRRDAPDGL